MSKGKVRQRSMNRKQEREIAVLNNLINAEKIVEGFEFFPVEEQLKILNNLKPFFTDSANYFGIYEEDIRKLCKGMGWNKR